MIAPVRKLFTTIAIVLIASALVPFLPGSVLPPAIALSVLFLGLPVIVLLTLDLGSHLRGATGISSGWRVFGQLLAIPQALLGVVSVVLGAGIVAWVLFNLFVERQPEFPHMTIPAFGVGPGLITVGLFWLRSAVAAARGRADLNAAPN